MMYPLKDSRVTSEASVRLRAIVRFTCALLLIGVAGTNGGTAVAMDVRSSAATASRHRVFTAKVTSVVDGDTLHVVGDDGVELVIRVEGIDCPESGQPYGGVARRFTRAEAFDRRVQVRVMDTDRHGRLVARVYLDGTDLSVRLLRAGLAWHYTDYSHDPVLAAAEQEARRAKRGLWSDASPVAPWLWRRQSRESHASRGVPDAAAGPFFGNTSSRVFHSATCKNAHCRNCSVTFSTAQAAEAAGYRPAGDCLR